MKSRILICDDDPGTLCLATLMLESRGWEVLTAGSGVEAVSLARREKPDAILLDLLMPAKNGWETLAELKEDPSTCDIPVVILSVLSQTEGEVFPADHRGWIQKPIDDRSLTRALEAVAGGERRPRILIIEDDPVTAQMLFTVFDQAGVEVLQAATGRVALAASRVTVPDLIILDIALPDADGFGIVAEMRRDPMLRRIPLVVYSARDLDRSDRQRLELGKTEILTKGRISLEELEQHVMRLLPAGAKG